MKIVYVITRSDVIGGASVHLLDLALGSFQAGHSVDILVGGEGVFNSRARDLGLSCFPLKYLVREINPRKDIRAFFELRKMLSKLKPDLVHLHSSKAGILGRLAAKSLGLPAIFTAHGWAFTEGVSAKRRFLYRNIERIMARFSEQILTVSEFDRQLALKAKVGDEASVLTIHNGMPEVSSNIVSLTESDKVRLIMVARFEVPKNQKFLLEALAKVAPKNWELELVGDGPSFSSVQTLAAHLGIGEKVVFSGACDDVPIRLSRSDVFVLISDWEGLPLTILEAMRTGLPVIASNVGGVSELVANGENGFVVERGDQKGLMDALTQLINSPELRKKQGLLGQHIYRTNFTFDIMLDKILKIYQKVLDRAK
ncbi:MULTISPECIES: glycosyltransferase family 4 protein [unclassified Pseudomonas]|uniref:glycosyltransferase family 4 protein n=1 Tax=unclassified Pseudomonas TaxID=196821 RepID=UPI000F56547A|nr:MULTISPECIES: glycosyltransferase family 4 protein [unclassified Pseudomonas]AZF20409.1 Exopolysaccharide biosynthesis glycosyltransferase EpsF [Pseudomonas sp. R3-52-08]AZF25743.1 Exopolysaccharide biosynthesis glycosyltransferase EpsF [Pseudomonas sp. R2-60-08W]